ncbi:ABC transporter ATP-binding protein [Taklimakanibacter lacteus]|uniref:ABC transporter ATP-binding protein n=1 Tax=Taklimakanibacter lacteus TaxID=2268456 RepID=UPI0034D3C680
MFERIFSWLESRTDTFPPVKPEKPGDTLWGFVWHYTRPFWPMILICSALASAVALIEVALFSFLGSLVDWLSTANRETFWQDHGSRLIVMAVLVLVVLPVLKFWYEAVVHQGLIGNFAMRIRWLAHRYVLRQSVDFFQNDFAGRIATKVMQAAMGTRDTVMKITEVLVYVGVYFTGAVVAFAASDWRLAVPLVLWFVAYLLIMRHFVPLLGKASKAQADARSMVTGRIVDSYTNIATVKLFAHADREDLYAKDGLSHMLDTVYNSLRTTTRMTVALNVMNALLLFSTGTLAIWLWTLDAVTTGVLAFTVSLILRMQGMAHWILWEVAGLFEDIGTVQDGIETIARERSLVDAPDARPLQVTSGRISFDDVSFNYGKAVEADGRGVVDDLTLTIAPGEKVGLVGRSGAGKSTLVNLLLRFYDLRQGRILIDGQDISRVTQESLREQIGLVTQDTSLLHRSVKDNIAYGKPEATMDEIVDAARRAHADEFIPHLLDPKGRRAYEAHVGERGVKLSGGQRQRVAIARVLLKDAPILILDEATSALDSEIEAAIQESLYSLMEGKTVIAVAHRLSTIAAMDRLIIMDKGRIVEEGSHDMLLRQGGLYADLWRRQSGGFLAREAAE